MSDIATGNGEGSEGEAKSGGEILSPWDLRIEARRHMKSVLAREQAKVKVMELFGAHYEDLVSKAKDVLEGMLSDVQTEVLENSPNDDDHLRVSSDEARPGVIMWIAKVTYEKLQEAQAETCGACYRPDMVEDTDGFVVCYFRDGLYTAGRNSMDFSFDTASYGRENLAPFSVYYDYVYRLEGANGEVWANSDVDQDELVRPDWISELE